MDGDMARDKVKVLSSDAEWRAESDARTMAEYEAIVGDRRRLAAAVKAARAKADEYGGMAERMGRVASRKPGGAPKGAPKGASRPKPGRGSR